MKINNLLNELKNRTPTLSFKELGESLKKFGNLISNATIEKIRTAIRAKAYKDVVKESVKRNIDINQISAEDLEYLMADREKEIKKKIQDMTLAAIATYLGIDLLGV